MYHFNRWCLHFHKYLGLTWLITICIWCRSHWRRPTGDGNILSYLIQLYLLAVELCAESRGRWWPRGRETTRRCCPTEISELLTSTPRQSDDGKPPMRCRETGKDRCAAGRLWSGIWLNRIQPGPTYAWINHWVKNVIFQHYHYYSHHYHHFHHYYH